MKISDKQIMQLIQIARLCEETLRQNGMMGEIQSYKIQHVIDGIVNQQSEELKETSYE